MLNSKEVTLKGCLGHDEDDILAAIDLFTKGKVDANEFISNVIKLEDMQKTFERFVESEDRDFIKIIVEPK
jgi:threonine dehydrogenase-like Zn-dependent dehydrogenase